MTHMPQISRRFFLTTAAAAGGGLALGFHLPDAAPGRGRGGPRRGQCLGGDPAR